MHDTKENCKKKMATWNPGGEEHARQTKRKSTKSKVTSSTFDLAADLANDFV